MDEYVVHIVGPGYSVGPICRQRCAWCGFKLIDDDARLMASADGHGSRFFPIDRFIAVSVGDGFVGRILIEHEDKERLPANCCAAQPAEAPILRVVR